MLLKRDFIGKIKILWPTRHSHSDGPTAESRNIFKEEQ
jgi:hypothetical protein